MRISDWSSDVCSSDLPPSRNNNPNRRLLTEPPSRSWLAEFRATGFLSGLSWFAVRFLSLTHFALDVSKGNLPGIRLQPILTLITPNLLASDEFSPRVHEAGDRSEEHTSELQSLMRISYAVFCLKKKT